MRHAPFLALPLLTLSLSAFAQQPASALKTDPVPDNQPFELRLEAPPAPNPDRLVLNRSKAEFRIWYESLKQGDSAAAAPVVATPNALGIPVPPAGGATPTIEPAGNGGLVLAQPGLPANAASATPAAQPAQPAPAVEPPAPVPRTMAQAAEALPKPADPAPAKPAVLSEQPPAKPEVAEHETQPRLLDKMQSYIKSHRKEALMGAGAIVLLLVLVVRMTRRRESDESDE